MFKRPAFIQTFGNLKIKIWSYPKEILRSLINGLKQNSNTLHKVTSVIGFKHSISDYYFGCNCIDKVEDICLKFSVNAHRHGKVYIPLEVLDSHSSLHEIYICELRSTEACKKHPSNTISVVPDNEYSVCLLKLATNTKSIYQQENKYENRNTIQCEEKPNNHLFNCPGSSDKLPTNVNKLIDMCLKFNLPSQDIINIIRDLKTKCQENKNFVRKDTGGRNSTNSKFDLTTQIGHDARISECMDKISNPHTASASGNNNRGSYMNSQYKNPKHFKLTRSPSPNTHSRSCNDDYETDYSRSYSPELICSEMQQNPMKHDYGNSINSLRKLQSQVNSRSMVTTNVEKDIRDIKSILKEIIGLLNETGNQDMNFPEECEIEEDIDVQNCESDQNVDVLQAILQELVKCNNINKSVSKKDQIGKPKKSMINSKANQCEELMESSAETPRHKIYNYLPHSIPVIPKNQEESAVPILDAYDLNLPSITKQDPCDAIAKQSKSHNSAIKIALENAGVPAKISEQITDLTLSGNGAGVTNIYYYINGDPASNVDRHNRGTKNSCKETELVIEHQSVSRIEQDDKKDNHSHIMVDFNSPTDDKEFEGSQKLLTMRKSNESPLHLDINNVSRGSSKHTKQAKIDESMESSPRKSS